MSRFVVLKLDGDLDKQGFQITLDIAQEGHYPALSEDGALPPNPVLAQHLLDWQASYGELTQASRILQPYKIQYDGSLNSSLDQCIKAAEELEISFKQWLRTESFRDLERQLCRTLATDDVIRVLIRSKNKQLHALPWHLWPFIEDYPNAEIAMGSPRFQRTMEEPRWTQSKTPKVSILAILGDRTNIDIDTDRQLLNQLPGADITLLVEPTPQTFQDQLYDRPWDILFFAGHSDTLNDEHGEDVGILKLNPDTFLTIEALKYGMRKAIANGLQLAIFNSCSGVGLAHALAELQLPQMIVMRQAIPDHVAHTFLKYFLEAFASGTSFYSAEREARERLQAIEQDFPCASWLPMIYQHPAKTPPTWQMLSNSSQIQPSHPVTIPTTPQPSPTQSRKRGVAVVAIASVIATSLVVGARSLGLLQAWELKAYDHLMNARPGQRISDNRILVVAVTEDDIQYQRNQGMAMEGSLSDDALLQLLQKISPYHPRVIGSDIFHDFPFKPELQEQLQQHDLIAICEARNAGSGLSGIAPPENRPVQSLGFSNLPVDPDGAIRRQLLGMTADEICPTRYSLSFRLAQRYLNDIKNIGIHLPDPKQVSHLATASSVRLPISDQNLFLRLKLMNNAAGGYQLPPYETNGYQVLVNYRAAAPEQVSLREILSGLLDSRLQQLVRDRIILIGVVKPQVDTHLTPYTNKATGERVSGVVIQAQMTSQIISAVLGEHPLILWWSEWQESLWIVGWGIIGAIMMMWRSPYLRLFSFAFGGIILWGMCLLLLVNGWWVPFIPGVLALSLAAAIAFSINRITKRS